MQVSIENFGSLGRKLTVRLPAQRLEDRVRSRLTELSRTARIKGFRPGKVPAKVIEQRFGGQVRNEALSDMIGSSFQEAITQEKLRPAMQPSIATTGRPENGEIEYTATFEVLPEIGKLDVAALEIVKPVASVTDADIDQMIETLRLQRRTWAQVERAAREGDMVLFEYSAQGEGFRHPESGMDRVGAILGSGAYSRDLEDKIVGRSSGDTFKAHIDFPSTARTPILAGKSADVEVHLVRVQEAALPAIDDAFVASFGVKEGGMQRFREDVRANLERELKGVLMSRLKADALDKLVAAHPELEIPQGLVEAEARQLAQQAGAQTAEAVADYHGVARRRVGAGLLIAELAKQNQIRLEAQRVREALAMIASTYEEPQQVVELYSRDPQLMSALQNRVMEDQVVEWLAEHAKCNEQSLSFNDVMRPGA
ncbi:MAG: trigger factor [Dokdonella sp.]|uniref:trigger factor n=1 Tax=Dokdonella sp. TaxID=2291710 RepID=UPI0025C6B7FC|nr:trigger factor [Dokdonella sp.]MBZ0223343.1 trigger factor [Dokdonella sp.]MCC7255331.1 trigger factor [Dokdonella sp.]